MSAFDVLESTREQAGQSESRLTTAGRTFAPSAPVLIQSRRMQLKRVMDVVLAALLFLLLMLPMALSYDHRVIDGANAARFIVDLVKAFETMKMEG